MISATLHGDSIYMTRVTQGTSGPTFSTPIQIASGLRNAAGIAFHPTTHDLYFEDNGIDKPDNEELSTDEMNRMRAADIGNGVPNFGFAHDYIEYRTGNRIGSGAVQPLGAFQPYPDPNTGGESAGANEIAFAPSRFPAGLSGGMFIGFHGEFDQTGAANGENAVVYFDPETGKYFHFIESGQDGLGHPDGLLTTDDSLFVADMSSGSIFGPQAMGAIYQIQVVPEPGLGQMTANCLGLTALCRRSRARSDRRRFFQPPDVLRPPAIIPYTPRDASL
jgi:glucose/arabinose dehydrogenase